MTKKKLIIILLSLFVCVCAGIGTKHTETAWVERTEIVKGSRSTDYHIYVDDGNGQSVRYTTTRSIVTDKQAGDTVTLLINDSVFGIRQIVVRK